MLPDPDAVDPDIRRFEEQYAENPESFVFARLADAYRKSGRPERALALLEEGLSRHPEYLSARIVLARTLRDMGRTEEAAAAFGRVLELDARNLVAVRALAEIADRRPELGSVRRSLARLREMGSLDEEARSILEKVPSAPEGPRTEETPQEGPSTPTAAPSGTDAGRDRVEAPGEEGEGLATVTLAELHMAQGLHAEAVRIYERLLERRPGDPELARGLERARRLRDGEPLDGMEAGPEAAGGDPGRTEPGEGTSPEAPREPPDPGEAPPEMTIREYLVRLLEGRAPSGRSSEPPFEGPSRPAPGRDAGAGIASAAGT